MRVDFLIAGVQKAATSALHAFLRQHPELHLPHRKEMHYFDNDSIDWSAPDYERGYDRWFAEAQPGQLRGEATPIYTYWPHCLERIRHYNPRIKLIVALRHPAERAWSHWRMELARNAETLSFSEAIRGGRARVSGADGGVHRVYSYVERGFYGAQLDSVFALFPRDRVLLLRQEQLLGKPESTLDQVCDFLGVDRFSRYPESRLVFSHQKAGAPPMSAEDFEYLSRIYADDLRDLRDRYGITFETPACALPAHVCGEANAAGAFAASQLSC